MITQDEHTARHSPAGACVFPAGSTATRVHPCVGSAGLFSGIEMPQKKASPRARYRQQKWHARDRGIEWLLTFDEWWQIWEESGMYPLRGCGIGKYVMARTGDKGPYAVGNVRIALWSDNVAEASFSNGSLGRGRGWTYVANTKNPYQVVVRKKYIGLFATASEAEAAYRAACAATVRPRESGCISSRDAGFRTA